MGFIQIIEYTTTRFDEAVALGEKFEKEVAPALEGPRPLKVTVLADREQPNRYMSIVEFASFEAAMANSSRPETAEFARQMAELCEGQPVFRNLDVRRTFTP